MNLLKIHVIEDEDLEDILSETDCVSVEDIDCSQFDFDWDYHQIAFVNADTGERLLWNDNIHTHIEDDIENVLYGLKIAGVEVSLKEIAMMDKDVLNKYTGVKYR
jgi:hypothetical protein